MNKERELLEWLLRSVYQDGGVYYPDCDFNDLIEEAKKLLGESK